MRKTVPLLLLSTCIALAFADARAQSNNSQEPYWGHKSEGWHFYEPKPEKPAPRPEPTPEPTPEPSPPPAEPQVAGPAPLSAEWIQINLPKYRLKAIDDPTPENVELVAYLQRLSMDKAERYSQAMMQVPINNPALDEFARSPITSAQRTAAEKSISEAKKQTLQMLSQRVGIWYFFQSKCPYCAQQDPILERFQDRSAFQILPISLDGGPLASGSTRQYVVNQGQAEQLGVITTPTMVVADTATGQLHNLAAGLRTVSELEERLLQLAKQQNWISEAQYDEAVRGEPRMFLTDGLKGAGGLEDDPAALLEALKTASTNGGSTPWVVPPNSQGAPQ